MIPRLAIIVEHEAAPRVRVYADNEQDKQALLAWVKATHELAVLVGHGLSLDPTYAELRDAA